MYRGIDMAPKSIKKNVVTCCDVCSARYRILWLLCLLACLTSLLAYIISQVFLYNEKLVATKIVYELNDSLVFPR